MKTSMTQRDWVYLLQDEIEIDALFPVDVRITEPRQLFRVSSVNLDLHLKPKQVTVTSNLTSDAPHLSFWWNI